MAMKGGANRRRFRLLPTVLLTVAILGLPTAVYAWGRTSSSFRIAHVRVTGTDLVPARKASRLLRREYLGKNLFTVTSTDVRTTLRPLAYVQDAQVDRDFPDTLRVTVVEHRPVFYVLASNGWFAVADDGFVICPAAVGPGDSAAQTGGGAQDLGASPASTSSSPASPSPSASSSPSSAASPGAGAAGAQGKGSAAAGATTAGATTGAAARAADLTHLTAPSAALTKGPPHAPLHLPTMALAAPLKSGAALGRDDVGAALQVLGILPARLGRDVKVVQVTAQLDVALWFGSGLAVRWGDAQRLLAKRLALAAVLNAYADAGKDATFIDVSVPDRVLARPILK
jgi:cell division septal protein FtsQ